MILKKKKIQNPLNVGYQEEGKEGKVDRSWLVNCVSLKVMLFSGEYGKHMSNGDDGDHLGFRMAYEYVSHFCDIYPRQLKAGVILIVVYRLWRGTRVWLLRQSMVGGCGVAEQSCSPHGSQEAE